MFQSGTGSLQGGKVVMEVGPPGGRWAMKWNRDPLQLSGAVTAPLTATSGPFFLQPRGLSRLGSLLPVPCSWGQTAPQRQARMAKSPPVGRRHPPVLSSYFHSWSHTLASVGSLVHTQWLPFPGLIFSMLLLEILKWINPHRKVFFLFCLLKNAIQEARPNT